MKKSLVTKTIFRPLLFLLLVVGTLTSHAQAVQPTTSHVPATANNTVYVLVHGAWHGGWCWQQVSARLRATGAVVYTPTLSGLGEHQNTLNADINLSTHIADIVNLLVEEDLHNVVLVGHSYAGAVITGVADQVPERLSQLVYLDALLLENGQNLVSMHTQAQQEAMEKAAASSNGLTLPVFSSQNFGVTVPADSKWVDARLTPQPYRCYKEPMKLTHPLGNHLPLAYIACTTPELAVLEQFAIRARTSKEWKYYELPTGHDAMISMPNELAAMLERISK